MTGRKRLVPLIFVGVAIALLALRHQHDLLEAIRLLHAARSVPIAGALACQCLYYLFATLTVNQCLRLVDFRLPFSQALRSTFLLIFVNRIVPGPAATGPAAIYVILGRRGLDRTKAAFVGPLFYAADYGAFFVLLLIGVLAAALRRQDVRPAAAAIPVAAVACLVTATVGRVWYRPDRLRRFLVRWRGTANRFLPAQLHIGEAGPANVANEVTVMRDRLRLYPGIGRGLAAAALAMLTCDVLTMAFCFSAFGYTPPPSTALLGFCLATVGAIVSFLPGGLGTFEMAMILGFVGLGSPKPVAVAATLVYRVIATWLPAVPGLFASGELSATYEHQSRSEEP